MPVGAWQHADSPPQYKPMKSRCSAPSSTNHEPIVSLPLLTFYLIYVSLIYFHFSDTLCLNPQLPLATVPPPLPSPPLSLSHSLSLSLSLSLSPSLSLSLSLPSLSLSD